LADLEQPGQPTSQPVTAPTQGEPQEPTGEPAPQVAQPSPTPTIVIPDKFKGKSAEDVYASYLESEKEKGRLAQELGEQRRITQWLTEEKLRAAQQAQEQPPQEQTKPEFDWEKPLETIDERVERKLAEREAAQKYYQRQNVFQRAAVAHDEGKAAMTKNPKLYEGIEGEVEQAVFQGLAPYANQGYDVSEALRNPKTWEQAAAFMRIQKSQYDRLSFATQPMSAQAGELPSQTRQQVSAETIPITQDDRIEAAKVGITDEKEIREILQLGRKTYRGTLERK